MKTADLSSLSPAAGDCLRRLSIAVRAPVRHWAASASAGAPVGEPAARCASSVATAAIIYAIYRHIAELVKPG